MTPDEAVQLLELNLPVTKSELKLAYREALMVWHPDRFEGNDKLQTKAHKRACLINEAYALLSSRLDEGDTKQKNPQSKRAADPAKHHRQNTPPQGQRERSSAASSPNPAEENKAGFIARFITYWSTNGYDFVHSIKSQRTNTISEVGIASQNRIMVMDGDGLTDQAIVSEIRELRTLVNHGIHGEWVQERVLIIFSEHARAEDFLKGSSRHCVHLQFWKRIKTKGWIADLEAEMIHAAKHPMSSIDIGDSVAISKMNKVLFNKT